MCKLCDEGKPQDHTGSPLGRRDFLKASAATAVAATGMNFLSAPAAAARDDDDDHPRDSGRPGRRYVIRGGHVMSMDPKVGDFVEADVLVEGKKILAVGPNLHVHGAGGSTPAAGSSCPASSIRTITCSRPALRSFLADGLLFNDGTAARRDQLLPVHSRHVRSRVSAAGRLHQRAVRLAQPARRGRHDVPRHLADPSHARALRRRDQGPRRLRATRRLRLFRERRSPICMAPD